MTKTVFAILVFLAMHAHSTAQKVWHVYVFVAEECPVCNYMGKPLSTIATKYQDRVEFHAVFPFKNSNYKTSQLFKEQYEMLTFETLLDKDHSITKQLGASVTPEAEWRNGSKTMADSCWLLYHDGCLPIDSF